MDDTPVDVAISCLQKAVRRGQEAAAIYWVKQLYLCREKKICGVHIFKKLLVYSAEDVGLADLSVKTRVVELNQMAELV